MVARQLLVFSAVLVACVGCDHASKQVAQSLLAESGGLALLGGAIRLDLVFNRGAFLSLGATLPEAARHAILMIAVPLLVGAACLLFLRFARASLAQGVAVGLVAGGGLGNWLDRALHGGTVTDFVSVGLGGLRTGIFNFADLAIVGGALGLLWLARDQRETSRERCS